MPRENLARISDAPSHTKESDESAFADCLPAFALASAALAAVSVEGFLLCVASAALAADDTDATAFAVAWVASESFGRFLSEEDEAAGLARLGAMTQHGQSGKATRQANKVLSRQAAGQKNVGKIMY